VRKPSAVSSVLVGLKWGLLNPRLAVFQLSGWGASAVASIASTLLLAELLLKLASSPSIEGGLLQLLAEAIRARELAAIAAASAVAVGLAEAFSWMPAMLYLRSLLRAEEAETGEALSAVLMSPLKPLTVAFTKLAAQLLLIAPALAYLAARLAETPPGMWLQELAGCAWLLLASAAWYAATELAFTYAYCFAAEGLGAASSIAASAALFARAPAFTFTLRAVYFLLLAASATLLSVGDLVVPGFSLSMSALLALYLNPSKMASVMSAYMLLRGELPAPPPPSEARVLAALAGGLRSAVKALAKAARELVPEAALSAAVLAALMLAGYHRGSVAAGALSSKAAEAIRALLSREPSLTALESSGLAMLIMSHNWQIGLASASSGVLVATPLLISAVNGYVIGLAVGFLKPIVGEPIELKLIPHGIVEVPAFILCCSLGLKLSRAVASSLRRGSSLSSELLESIALAAAGTLPLFIAAAIIEAFISPYM